MKIYISHSSKSNFREELYVPLRQSELNKRAEIILPHEKSEALYDSKSELKTCQWMVAEVSEPSIGVGVEMGWAGMYGVPMIVIHKKGVAVPSAATRVAKHILEYETQTDLIAGLEKLIIC